MTDVETAIAQLCIALQRLDDQGKQLTAEVAEINKHLAEAIELLKQAPVMRAQVSHNIPLIKG